MRTDGAKDKVKKRNMRRLKDYVCTRADGTEYSGKPYRSRKECLADNPDAVDCYALPGYHITEYKDAPQYGAKHKPTK